MTRFAHAALATGLPLTMPASPARRTKPVAAQPAAEAAEVDAKTLIARVLARRKGLPFDPKRAGGGKGGNELDLPARKYGVAAHARSISSVPEAAENQVLSMVDYQRLNDTILEGGAMRVPWEVFLQGFLDGYAVARELTGESRKAPKALGSKGAVTQFVKATAERWEAVAAGALAPIFQELLGELFTLHGEGLRKPTAAAFAIGARLRCQETGASHPFLEELLDGGPKKPRGLAIPKGKAPANEDLLGAILARPDDDASRLVYADYLTSAGDSRGEFIQLQCLLGNEIRKAGKVSTAPTKPVENAEAMVKRAEALLKHSKGQWLGGTGLSDVTWARGFPADGYCEASDFLENAAYDRVPLAGIRLIHWSGKLADAMFRRAPHPTLRRFWFGSGFGTKVLQVVGAPVFSGARELEAGFWDDGPVPPKALEVLGKASFPHLEVLQGAPQLLAALPGAGCPRLHTFKVKLGGPIAPARASRLWRQVKRLESFRLEDGTGLAGQGEPEFAALKDAASLEVISAVAAELNEQSVRALIDAAPKSLHTLEGGFGELPPALVQALAARFKLLGY